MSTFLKDCIIAYFKENRTKFGIDNERYEGDDGVMLIVDGCHYYQAGSEASKGKMTKEGLEEHMKALGREGKIESSGWKFPGKAPPELKIFFPGFVVPERNEYSWWRLHDPNDYI